MKKMFNNRLKNGAALMVIVFGIAICFSQNIYAQSFEVQGDDSEITVTMDEAEAEGVVDNDNLLPAPTNIVVSPKNFMVTFDAVDGAEKYCVRLYKGDKRVTTYYTTHLTVDLFAAYITENNEYYVTVYAMDKANKQIGEVGYSEKITINAAKGNLATPVARWSDTNSSSIVLDKGTYIGGYRLFADPQEKRETYSLILTEFEGTYDGLEAWLSRRGAGTYSIYIQALSNDFSVYLSSAKSNKIEYKCIDNKLKQFVERLYSNVLGRAGDTEGINSWVNALVNGTQNGATVSAGFVFSDEFTNRNLTNAERVDIMYQTFLNRAADEGGKKMWVDALDSGVGIEKIYEGFVMSDEFAAICSSYGISTGQMSDVPGLVDKLNLYRNRNLNVTGFVARCYTKALGRDKDIDGVEMWCRMIITKEWTPRNVALGFIHSDEFVNKNTTNEEYVSILYRTFLGRELDAPGAATWVGILDRNERTRDQVADGFADSDEFRGILAGFGLN